MPLPNLSSNLTQKRVSPLLDDKKNPSTNDKQDLKASLSPAPEAPPKVSIGKEKEAILAEEKALMEVRKSLEMEIDKEVKEAGVKEIKGTIELPQKVIKETGIKQVGEGVPFPQKPTIKLPLDDKKIKTAIKKNKVVDSILWLAHWCIRQIKIARFKALKMLGVKAKIS